MDTDNNTEEVTIFNDVSNYELLNDLDKFDIENMPLIFDSDFDVVKEIEVVTPQIEKEYTKREIINTKEKLDVVDIRLKNTTSNIKVTSIENFNNKNVKIDLSQYRKISLSDPLKPKTKGNNKKYYTKDEDILRDLMDST